MGARGEFIKTISCGRGGVGTGGAEGEVRRLTADKTNEAKQGQAVSTAPLTTGKAQRRSQRILLAIRVGVAGERADGQKFSETAFTQVVNAHGGLISIKEPLQAGQTVIVQHAKTGEKVTCRVVEVTSRPEGMYEVGIAFSEASPHFWHVAFPPEDWTPRSPEAKRSEGPRAYPSSKLKTKA
jgi:predicted RNA-binding protein with TRAM domain